jgi:hypothetical protein
MNSVHQSMKLKELNFIVFVGEGVFSKMGLPLWSKFLGEDGFATKILAK